VGLWARVGTIRNGLPVQVADCTFCVKHSILCTPSSLAISHPLQERTPKRGEPECLLQLTGQDLIGLPLASPNTDTEIYVLPLLTILTNKGTGIVTSVPSDSPDDYIALQVGIWGAGATAGRGLAFGSGRVGGGCRE
jgi:hypothetical protein